MLVGNVASHSNVHVICLKYSVWKFLEDFIFVFIFSLDVCVLMHLEKIYLIPTTILPTPMVSKRGQFCFKKQQFAVMY